MMKSVRTFCHKHEILWATVVNVTINVMDNFVITKRSSEGVAHHEAVNKNVSVFHRIRMGRHPDCGIAIADQHRFPCVSPAGFPAFVVTSNIANWISFFDFPSNSSTWSELSSASASANHGENIAPLKIKRNKK